MFDIVNENIKYGLFHAFDGIVRDLDGEVLCGEVEEIVYDLYGGTVAVAWNQYVKTCIKEEV